MINVLKWRMGPFSKDIGIILFILGKGKRIKIVCHCPSHSAWFVQQSPHMGTIKRMGKYLNTVKSKFLSKDRENPVEITYYYERAVFWVSWGMQCLFLFWKKIMHLFIWILFYICNMSLLPYRNSCYRARDFFLWQKACISFRSECLSVLCSVLFTIAYESS